MRFILLIACLQLAILLPLLEVSYGQDSTESGEAAEFFEKQVRPVLATNCIKCHGAKKQEGGLRLDSRKAMLVGGDGGPAIVPKNLEESLLVEAIRYEGAEMPPAGQLPAKEIEVVEAWIRGGALWPEHAEAIRDTSGTITETDREWWAFLPIQPLEVPLLEDDQWSRTDIDRFVYQKMVAQGIEPAPEADREKLIRRLYFDLIGLPPTPAEIAEFNTDRSEDAWESLIDKLLADERYGEHWARFWLDVVRYAESDGWNKDSFRPNIWRYRDYVVNAFNVDKPYPEFVRQQLAAMKLR